MRAYRKARYPKIKSTMIRMLGGKCALCGSTKRLEFDHIGPKSKTFDPLKVWSFSEEMREKELLKCQLLCKQCHLWKTLTERGKKTAKNTHGTVSAYRYCHCVECKEAKRVAAAEYRDRKRPLRRSYVKGIKHGTRSTYVHYRCRCRACREAQSSHFRKYRATQGAPSKLAMRRSVKP